MNEISYTRMISQQLLQPQFDEPKDLVSWMGAMQGQDYTMAKWALGMRLKSPSVKKVEDALSRGDILRTHVMRPTWHIVAAEDIRWMVELSSKRIKSAMTSWRKDLEISDKFSSDGINLIAKFLEGGKSLSKKEIEALLTQEGIQVDNRRLVHFLSMAETENIICSGIDKGREYTFALTDERVPPTRPLHKDEALAKLALSYFRSHSPATLDDFVWWSGLSKTEAKNAIAFIEDKLIREKFKSDQLYIHESYTDVSISEKICHLIPPYDEYLISYKSRVHTLPLHHYSKAFNNNGIFQPVVLYNGTIVGNWRKKTSKNNIDIETNFFEEKTSIPKTLLEKAKKNYKLFLEN